MGKIATFAIDTARQLSQMFGNELAVIVTPHKIKIRMLDPDNTRRDWDSRMFESGNIFLAGFANPVKPKIPDTEEDAKESYEMDMIASERYKDYMEQSLIKDIIREGKDDKLTLRMVVLILGIMQLLTMVLLFWGLFL